ncbi:MAG TPA: twin-arginine translocase TatA/TatE family subunit [Solirubrobacteraceae bacterium]|nr:twin-arginine translocase TatA/TatE family subunit [Solirubrobacteraceae bacterium]
MGLDNPIHIAFLLILLLLVFGAKRLPEMGRSLGDGMRGFKDALGGHGAGTAAAVVPEQTPAQPALTPAAEPTLAPAPAAAEAVSRPQAERVPAA